MPTVGKKKSKEDIRQIYQEHYSRYNPPHVYHVARESQRSESERERDFTYSGNHADLQTLLTGGQGSLPGNVS